ncbi:MAG: hypothetical protein V1904_08890 [Bacteroidota bacterium]
MSSVIKSQNREFIAGPLIGFYGIHINGDIQEMYSPVNGTVWGTGGLSSGFNVKHFFSKNLYGTLEFVFYL